MASDPIEVQRRERPESGMGSRSPRYELHVRCCGIFLAADDSLETVRTNASKRGVAAQALVIYDLGAPRPLRY